MKILFSSYTFAPNVGGIESVSAILAEKFAEAGHEVELVTETGEGENAQRSTFNVQRSNSDGKYRITRRPSLWKLLQLLSWCELVFQNNISLRSLIPALLMRKRVIVVHQTWLRNVRGRIGWNNRIKRALLRFVANVAISEAIRDDICREGDAPALQLQVRVIDNPYDDCVFRLRPEIARDKTLVFVGRLVSDKGVDLMLRTMNILRFAEENVQPASAVDGLRPGERPTRLRPATAWQAPNSESVRERAVQRPMAEEGNVKHQTSNIKPRDGLHPDLTIIGAGPEEQDLRRLAGDLGLDRQVTFAGEGSGDELAAILNQHQIMVV
ncbi:MAG: glycosyltransferase family 4 protein, partial [Chthoniobacterales bacterium]